MTREPVYNVTHLRDLQPGAKFVLNRTGDRYLFIRRDHDTPGGTRYVVQRMGFARPTTLHHSCRVTRLEEPT